MLKAIEQAELMDVNRGVFVSGADLARRGPRRLAVIGRYSQLRKDITMKHILSQCLAAGVLPLAAPIAATAGPRQQADDAGAAVYLPILIVGIVLVSLVARQMFRRPAKAAPLEPGQSRDYGAAGAAVCRGCGLPFARDVLDLNMLVGKLVRCPHCGKWAVLPAASPAEVAAAEERERQKLRGGAPATAVTPQLSKEEQLRRRIEDSRYE